MLYILTLVIKNKASSAEFALDWCYVPIKSTNIVAMEYDTRPVVP